MARVALVFGGRSVEHQVSLRSARTIARALATAGHEVVPLGIALDGSWLDGATSAAALAGNVEALEPPECCGKPPFALLRDDVDAVFPIVHGTWGEDGTLQGFFEILDLAYVGAGVAASAVAMDKALTKRLLAAAGLPVVDCELVTARELAADRPACLARARRLPLPVFVKPSVGGSSVGVRKVVAEADLGGALEFAMRFDDVVLVERGVAGRELECAVLGYEELAASAVGEIVPGREFYDYADKYLEDRAGLLAPAPLPEPLAERVRALAIAAFAAIGGHGMARVDFLLEGEDGLFVNEINTLPGFTDISMYPRLWGLAGVPLPELVDRLVGIARRRHADRRRLNEGIREFVASLRR
ncbi:MAG: D-alanine--D-alanine ligase family protein [Thermoanaerobaculia bacterium]